MEPMLQAGLIVVVVAVVSDLLRPGPRDAAAASEWLKEHRVAHAEFGRLLIAVACVAGVPLLAGGFAQLVVGTSSAAPWFIAVAAVVPGVVLLREVWSRRPDRRLDPAWWDRQARIGGGGRQRTIATLLVALGFVIGCGLLVALVG
jgi:hypothetical protein